MKGVNIDSSSCLKPCSGLIVTSFSKTAVTKGSENLVPIVNAYNKYKTITDYPRGQNGKYYLNNSCAKWFEKVHRVVGASESY